MNCLITYTHDNQISTTMIEAHSNDDAADLQARLSRSIPGAQLRTFVFQPTAVLPKLKKDKAPNEYRHS